MGVPTAARLMDVELRLLAVDRDGTDDAVVVAQPSHAADKEAAVVAAQTLVRLLAEPHEGTEIYVKDPDGIWIELLD